MLRRTLREKLDIGLYNLFSIFLFLFIPAQILAQTITGSASVNITAQVALTEGYKNGIADNSTIDVNPANVDTYQASEITATIIDEYGNHLPDHTIKIGIIGVNGVVFTQNSFSTDSNGQVTGQMYSSVPGVFNVYAIDETYKQTDNQEILLKQSPTIIVGLSITPTVPSPTPTPTITPTQVIKPTPSKVVGPTLTPTITLTPIPTISPTPSSIPRIITSRPNWWDVVVNLLTSSICEKTNLLWLFISLVILMYILLLRISQGKGKRFMNVYIHSIVVIVVTYLLLFVCISLLFGIIIWLIASFVLIKELRKKIIDVLLERK